jgi:hypothetical protein
VHRPTIEQEDDQQGVIEMAGLGLPDDVIIEKIQTATATDFDTSVAGLKALKAAKVLRGLAKGEYGFLPPGVSSASLSASGKMYTFGIME